MSATDAANMALGLSQIAGSLGSQVSRIAYRLHHTDGFENVLKSVFDFCFECLYTVLFSVKFSIEWYINQLFNDVNSPRKWSALLS